MHVLQDRPELQPVSSHQPHGPLDGFEPTQRGELIEQEQDGPLQLVAGSAGASGAGVGRVLTLGDRFRQATDKEAATDPELRAAQGNYMVARAIANGLNKGDPEGATRDAAHAREWIADQLDQGRVFEPGKVRDSEKGAVAVVEPIHEEIFPGRVRVQQPDRER